MSGALYAAKMARDERKERERQTKLKKGRTFSKPQEKLNRIWKIFEEDMVCCFCDGSWFYNEIAKVIEYDLDS